MNSVHLRLSSLQFLFWFAAANGAYLTVFLQQRGLQPDRVGLIAAINSAIVIVATPFWGTIADKIRSIRKVLLISISGAVLFWTLIPASTSIYIGPLALMYLIIPIGSFFRMPNNSMIEAFTVQSADLGGVVFGSVRIWGSIGWVIMCFALSFILPRTGVVFAFYIYGLSFIPFFLILFNTQDISRGKPKEKQTFKEMRFGRLFKNYYFITYLFFALLLHMPMTISFTFMPFLVESVGGDTSMIGLVTGFRALMEVPSLLLIKPIRKRFSLPFALGCAGLLFFIEILLLSRATSLWQIIVIQNIHGLGAGFLIGAAASYVYLMAPEGLNATAHTMLGAVNAVAAIFGSMVGGIMIMAVGIRTFYGIVAGILGFALVYFALSLLVGVKFLKKPIPKDEKTEPNVLEAE